MTQFSHITPTAYLYEFADKRPFHLLLAHLVEEDSTYAEWYEHNKSPKRHPGWVKPSYILDNSAFEMYKQGRPMYPSDKLIEMGKKVKADYIVMTDYPGEASEKTVNAAIDLGPKFHQAGFGTFFVPQSQVGDLNDLIEAYQWAVGYGKRYVDYIGVSILGVPNAYGVEKGNKLQRFSSRYSFMRKLYSLGILDKMRDNGQKLHFLGMVDGPREIELVEPFLDYIDTWDSSAAVWAGLNSIKFDDSPTGLINGKFEKEVDFDFTGASHDNIKLAHKNIDYIESMLNERNSLTGLQGCPSTTP